jgi:hypothetical protein
VGGVEGRRVEAVQVWGIMDGGERGWCAWTGEAAV